jgi:cytochrome P450
MSSYMVHTDENIFPDPFTFNPDRWIGNVKQLEKYLVSFSKGSRQCLGMK